VCIRWYDDQSGRAGAFTLRTGESQPWWPFVRITPTLDQRVQAWWEKGSARTSLHVESADLGLPDPGDVTSLSPGQYANPRAILFGLCRWLVLAAGLCVLLGVPFEPIPFSGAWYVFSVVALNTAFWWLPYWFYRDPV
jgi:hypothetical protein